MNTMGNANEIFGELRTLKIKYKLPVEDIDKLMNEFSGEKVCIPLIGKFSSGKSALCNALLGLGGRLLVEDITPETAIPTELVYCNDSESERVEVMRPSGDISRMQIEEWRSCEFTVNEAKSARVFLHNENLAHIPDLMLVDMPGFESGIEVHNKAINDYLQKSLAYIFAFPADEMTLRTSIRDILRELSMHDKHFAVVITKTDKITGEIYEQNIDQLRGDIAKQLGDCEYKICKTSSARKYIKEFCEILSEFQEQSRDILRGVHKNQFAKCSEPLIGHLRTLAENNGLSVSELEEEAENKRNEFEADRRKLERQGKEFERGVLGVVGRITADLQAALNSNLNQLVIMALNGSGVNEKINTIVRESVTASVQRYYTPVVEKYIKEAGECIGIEDVNGGSVFESGVGAELSGGDIAKTIGTSMIIDIFAPLVGIIYGITKLIEGLNRKKKREEEKARITQQLRADIFPNIVRQAESMLILKIENRNDEIREKAADAIKQKEETYNKAMAELKKKAEQQQAERAEEKRQLEADLARIEELNNAI